MTDFKFMAKFIAKHPLEGGVSYNKLTVQVKAVGVLVSNVTEMLPLNIRQGNRFGLLERLFFEYVMKKPCSRQDNACKNFHGLSQFLAFFSLKLQVHIKCDATTLIHTSHTHRNTKQLTLYGTLLSGHR